MRSIFVESLISQATICSRDIRGPDVSIITDRAQAALGTRFRRQGRLVGLGLDCVGLLLHAYGIEPERAPRDYQFNGYRLSSIEAHLRILGFRRISRPSARPEDLLIYQVANTQFHLGLKMERGILHADAMVRKVVESMAAEDWCLKRVYRRRSRGNSAWQR